MFVVPCSGLCLKNGKSNMGHDCAELILQGGNNIHAAGVSAVARVLKDNSVITTVSSNNYSISCLFLSFIFCIL